jgi:hypothetical protein
MKAAFKVLSWTAAAIWSVFVFVASNEPSEVQARTNDWLSLPVVGQLPAMALNFAGSPWVLALSFLGLGIAIGVKFANRKKVARVDKWWVSLGHEMLWLAHQIDELDWSGNTQAVIAKINVVGTKAAKNGLAFPSPDNGYATIQSLLPYLHQVSAYLGANEIEHARSAATKLSAKSLT